MKYKKNNGCPFSFSLTNFGDKWTLLILRDLIVWRKSYYDDFLAMDEGIATNILTDRLREMEENGLVTKEKGKEDKRRNLYKPTEKALDLIPMLFELMLWASKYDPKTKVTAKHVDLFTKKRASTIREWRKPFEKKKSP